MYVTYSDLIQIGIFIGRSHSDCVIQIFREKKIAAHYHE